MRKVLGEKPVTNHVNCGKDKRFNMKIVTNFSILGYLDSKEIQNS